jgi:hypothetical protein
MECWALTLLDPIALIEVWTLSGVVPSFMEMMYCPDNVVEPVKVGEAPV